MAKKDAIKFNPDNEVKSIKKIYDDFDKKIREIEAKRDEKIQAIIKKIEQRRIEKIRKDIE